MEIAANCLTCINHKLQDIIIILQQQIQNTVGRLESTLGVFAYIAGWQPAQCTCMSGQHLQHGQS